jgi:SPX domain protein involved in polyphosphate accumulation
MYPIEPIKLIEAHIIIETIFWKLQCFFSREVKNLIVHEEGYNKLCFQILTAYSKLLHVSRIFAQLLDSIQSRNMEEDILMHMVTPKYW